jgi:hypothetical protein
VQVIDNPVARRMPVAEVENAKAATPQPLHNLWPS